MGKRRSKYILPPPSERNIFKRFDKRHDEVLKLFGPEAHGRYDYLTSDAAALLLAKNPKSMQRTLRRMWESRYLNHIFLLNHEYKGGSTKAAYWPTSHRGKAKLEEFYGKGRVRIKYTNPKAANPKLRHTVQVNRLRALFSAAIHYHPDLSLAYLFPDGSFKDTFKGLKQISVNGTITHETRQYHIEPDLFSGFAHSQKGNVQNVLVEYQTSASHAAKTWEEAKDPLKSLERRYESYRQAFKQQRYRAWPDIKKQIRDPKNFRSLSVCAMAETEFENLLAMVKQLDHPGPGLNVTWFIRQSDLEEKISTVTESVSSTGKIVRERVITRESVLGIFGNIWRTPRDASLKSLLT